MRIYGAIPSRQPSALIGVGIRPPVGAAASADLRHYCPPIENQLGQSCVGHAIADAHFVALAATSKRLSARGVYVAARALARRSRADAIADIGCEPALAFDSLVATGAFVEDGRDFDDAQLNTAETWPEAMGSKRFAMADLAPIAEGDTDAIDRWLTQGAPVFFTMPVDAGYQALSVGQVYSGPTGPILGGHAQALVGYSATEYIAINSWGDGWGDSGYGHLARDFVRSSCRDLVAVRGGPLFS